MILGILLFLYLLGVAGMVFYILPIPLLHLIPSRLGSSQGARFLSAAVAGLSLGVYEMIGALLACHFLVSNDLSFVETNYISNPYYAHILVMASIVSGIVSGILLRLGMRFKKNIDFALFILGILVLLALALFTIFNVLFLS